MPAILLIAKGPYLRIFHKMLGGPLPPAERLTFGPPGAHLTIAERGFDLGVQVNCRPNRASAEVCFRGQIGNICPV